MGQSRISCRYQPRAVEYDPFKCCLKTPLRATLSLGFGMMACCPESIILIPAAVKALRVADARVITKSPDIRAGPETESVCH